MIRSRGSGSAARWRVATTVLAGFLVATPTAEAFAAEGPASPSNKASPSGRKGKPKRGKQARDAPPPLTSYQLELEIQQREGKIVVDRKRAIALLEEFIAKHSTNRAMPEALYRLAALYWERSQKQFLSDMGGWANRVDSCRKEPEECPNGPPPEPQLDLRDSQAIYVRLIGTYPWFRKIDTVYYLYGFSLRDQGRTEDAQKQFWAIINKHPQSTFVPDAWLAVGDHRFYVSNDFRSSLEAYLHVLDYPRSDSYAMALFKTAWCHWKLGESKLAVRRFKEVLDQGAADGRDADDRQRLADLREEALEYLVQVLSEDETNTPKDIHDFLASIDGRQYSRKVLIRLGEAYEAQTRYDKSVPTYRFLISLNTDHEDCARFQLHVITGVRGDGKVEEALVELTRLHEQYGPRSSWGKFHTEAALEAREEGRLVLLEFARSIHESAQEVEKATKAPDIIRYGLAARGYEDYIARYPSSGDAVQVSYNVGDIYYFKLAQKERAGDAYLRVGESAPVGKLHRDALLAAITAYEEVLAAGPISTDAPPPAGTPLSTPKPAEEEIKIEVEADGPPPEEPTSADATPQAGAKLYNRVETKFVRAVDLFSALFPTDEENGAVLYKLGEFFYARSDYDGAVQRFGRVVVDHPEHDNAAAAGDRILESLNSAKDYDNIELWAQKLKTTTAFKTKNEQRRLDRIIVDSLLKQGETLATRGYFARSASYYLRMAREFPKHEQAPMALGNAGAALERARKGQAATAIYERLANDYRGTPQAAQATLVVARVYENMGDYERAAARYDDLVERYPRHNGRADAMYNAGVLYQGLGDAKKASDRYRRYAKAYGKREDAAQVELRVGQVQAQSGNHKAAVKTLQRFVKRRSRSVHVIQANMLLGKSYIALGKNKSANKALSKAVKAARNKPGEVRVYGAQARYLQGELIHQEFEAAKLDQRPARLGKSLERKAALLGKAKDIYLDVLSLKTAEWSTAALYRIGESYEIFARSLREYPVPKGLTEDQQDAYNEQLDMFALMFEEEAIGAFRSGYERARELKIFNKYTRQIRQALGRLAKQEFPPIEEVGTDVRVAEGTGRGGRPIRRLRR